MRYKEIIKRSTKYADNLANGYDKNYYDKIYNEHLIEEIKKCLNNNNLIDINEKELVNLVNIYKEYDKDNYLSFVEKIIKQSRRRLDYTKVIDLFVNN